MNSIEIENTNIQLLVCSFNNTFFGINMENCLETKADIEILPVPYSKPHIAGIANLRGEITVVYDLGVLMNQKKRTSQNREMIVWLQISNKIFSIIVDSITEVIQDSTHSLKNANSYMSPKECEYISSILDTEIGLIQILNLEKIYSA